MKKLNIKLEHCYGIKKLESKLNTRGKYPEFGAV